MIDKKNNRVINEIKDELELSLKNRTKFEHVQHERRNKKREIDVEKEWEIIKEDFANKVSRYNGSIVRLENDLNTVASQHDSAVAAHFTKVDELVDLYDCHIMGLERRFLSDIDRSRHQFEEQRTIVDKKHSDSVNILKGEIDAIRTEELREIEKALLAYNQACQEVRNKAMEDSNSLRVKMESRKEEVEELIDANLLQYSQLTDQKKEDLEKLYKKDAESRKQIEAKLKRFDHVQNNIYSTKSKINQERMDFDERNAKVNAEKKKYIEEYHELKKKMIHVREIQKRKLANLTIAANKGKRALEDRRRDASHILKLHEHCRNLEIEQGLSLPPNLGSMINCTEHPARAVTPEADALNLDGTTVDKECSLDNFWLRQNIVKKQTEELELEERRLKCICQNLQVRILQCLVSNISNAIPRS